MKWILYGENVKGEIIGNYPKLPPTNGNFMQVLLGALEL